MLSADSWLCSQGSLLAVLRELYKMLGIKAGLAMCKALFAVISLALNYYFFIVVVLTILGNALILCLGISPGGIEGSYGVSGINHIQVSFKQGKHPTHCDLPLAPVLWSFSSLMAPL